MAETVEAAQLDAQGQAIILDRGTEPLVVMADAIRLEQIVLNLLANAIKYAPETQRIDVRLRRVGGAPGGEAELQVQDYGPGIGAAELPQIFTRYFQSAQAGSAAGGGLGLGLFITKEIVTAHGGSLTATSIAGAGATFTVRLPLHGPEGSRADISPQVSRRRERASRRTRTT